MKSQFPTMNMCDAQANYRANIFGERTYAHYTKAFSYYSPAYVLSNENLRWITGLITANVRRVLTTAASGDQPMFYSINGAEKIDTFDISFCAKAIMDTKTAALKILNRNEYISLIQNLHDANNIVSVPGMTKILHKMPKGTADFIRGMDGCKIFCNGLTPIRYKEFYPTDYEYEQMRDTVNDYFNFIWTDVESLHTHLTTEYDIINLSNIFEYLDNKQIHNTLASLRNHVRPGGYIIAQSGGFGIACNASAYRQASEKFKSWAKIGLIKESKKLANKEEVVVLQRTR